LKLTVIAVVGSKKSGKTTTVEALTGELTKRGFRVATVKHVSEPDFTIDTAGKDTWRFARSGAKTVVVVASSEIATIEKTSVRESLTEILSRCKGSDIVIMEGFKKLVGNKKDIPKIIVVKSAEEAREAAKNFAPILAFAGPYSTGKTYADVPYVDALKNSGKLAGLVEEVIKHH
jgi:molybdopterin-guanine dinucleotide biosynthesis protein MobB